MLKSLLKSMLSFLLNRLWLIRSLFLILICFCGYYLIHLHIPSRLLNFRSIQSSSPIEGFNQSEVNNNLNIFLVVEGAEEDMKLFANDIKNNLEVFDNFISSVYTQVPKEFYKRNKFKLLNFNQLEDLTNILKNPNLIPYLKNLNNFFEKKYLKNLDIIQLEKYKMDIVFILDGIEKFVEYKKELVSKSILEDFGQKSVDALIVGETYNMSLDKNMMLISIELSSNLLNNYSDLDVALNNIEIIIKKSELDFNVQSSLAGSLVVNHSEAKEFRTSLKLFVLVTLAIIIIAVTILMKDVFFSFIILLSILCSLICFLGISSFLIESNNIILILLALSSIILILDFGFRIIFTYIDKKNKITDPVVIVYSILQKYFYSMAGSGCIIVLSMLLVIFLDYGELSEIVTLFIINISIVLLSTIVLIPLLLISLNSHFNRKNKFLKIRNYLNFLLNNIILFINRFRKFIIFLFCIATIFMFSYGLIALNDYGHFKLVNYDFQKYTTEQKIENLFHFSSDYVSFITTDLKSTRDLARKVREFETVARVETIIDFIPDPDILELQFRYLKQQKRQMLNHELRKYMSGHDLKMYNREMQRLEANIIDLQGIDTLKGIVYNKSIRLVGEINDSLNLGNLTEYVSSLDSNFTKNELTYIHQLFSNALKNSFLDLTTSEVLEFENLPITIKTRFIDSKTNKFITRVYPKKNIYKEESFYENFNYEINSLNTDINKYSYYALELSRILKFENKVLVYILIFFSILIYMLLGSMKKTLACILLNFVTFIWILGILEFASIEFNFLYILITPIIVLLVISYFIDFFYAQKNQQLDLSYCRKMIKPMLVSSILIMLCFSPLYLGTYRVFVLFSQALCISLSVFYFLFFFILLCFFQLEKQNNESIINT